MSTITFEDERTKLVANVRPATYKDELRRMDMQQELSTKDYHDSNLMAVAIFTYPRLIASTPTGEMSLDGAQIEWPPTLEQVLDSSVDGIDLWFGEVRRLNPTWFRDIDSATQKKTETNPPTES
jgi:hypothetical protein